MSGDFLDHFSEGVALRGGVRAFLAREVAPRRHALEEADPAELVALYQGMARLGWFDLVGEGGSFGEVCALFNEVARCDGALATCLLAHYYAGALGAGSGVATTAVHLTPDELDDAVAARAPLLVPFIDGFTELVAVPVAAGDEVVIKVFTGAKPVLVETMGFMTAPLGRLALAELDLAPHGGEPRLALGAYVAAQKSFQIAALGVALGVMEGAYELAAAYAAQRRQGGKLLCEWSQVQYDLADLRVDLLAGRAMLERTLALRGAGAPGWALTADAVAVKLLDAFTGFVDRALKILGGFGYMQDYPQEKRFRDARLIECLFGRIDFKRLSVLR